MNRIKKILLVVVLSIILCHLHAQVYNERTGVPIYSEVNEEIFPDGWKTDEIAPKAVSLDALELERSFKVINNALDKYPIGLIKNNLKGVYLLKTIEFYGQEYGGTNSDDMVYIANEGIDAGYTDNYIETTFHHEFSSILLRNYPDFLNVENWTRINTLPYGEGGVQALKDSTDSQDFDSKYNSNGFLNEYATSSFENDFNTFAENLFNPSDEFYKSIKEYPKLKQKLELILEFFFALDKTLTRDYFIKSDIKAPTPEFSQGKEDLDKNRVIDLYKRLYLSSEIKTMIWNGNVSNCDCGTLSSDIYTKAENRINFFRVVTGLKPVKLNPKFNSMAQAAALLIKANNQLTHNPSNNMKCFSESAFNGCSKSCLGFTDFENFASTAFITAFIWDFGESNYYVGHRRWMLYSKLAEFGYGATDNSEALLTVDGVSYDSIPTPEYIAYPWEGYVPVNLIFPKWSFSIPENKTVDFSQTTITMANLEGVEIQVVKLEEYKNFLDHTLVWIAKGLFSENDINYGENHLEENGYLMIPIKVFIENVKVDGKMRSYQYWVEPIKI
jgi:hypothetical protein